MVARTVCTCLAHTLQKNGQTSPSLDPLAFQLVSALRHHQSNLSTATMTSSVKMQTLSSSYHPSSVAATRYQPSQLPRFSPRATFDDDEVTLTSQRDAETGRSGRTRKSLPRRILSNMLGPEDEADRRSGYTFYYVYVLVFFIVTLVGSTAPILGEHILSRGSTHSSPTPEAAPALTSAKPPPDVVGLGVPREPTVHPLFIGEALYVSSVLLLAQLVNRLVRCLNTRRNGAKAFILITAVAAAVSGVFVIAVGIAVYGEFDGLPGVDAKNAMVDGCMGSLIYWVVFAVVLMPCAFCCCRG